MSVTINLAANSVFGVTGLTHGRLDTPLDPTDDPIVIDINTVYAMTGDGDYQINLPAPGADETFGGAVVVLKHLADEGVEITIGRDSGVLIDGLAEDVITNVSNQVFSFYYIDANIGWMAGPATL